MTQLERVSFHVKRNTVKEGAELSLQMHHHRAEHWVVVSGTAKITNGDQEYLLTENQSTYIPVGVVHSLENPGKIPLELIEIQSKSNPVVIWVKMTLCVFDIATAGYDLEATLKTLIHRPGKGTVQQGVYGLLPDLLNLK